VRLLAENAVNAESSDGGAAVGSDFSAHAAVLLLRDVLRWKAAEVPEAVGTTTTAVNSLLQRARSQLETVRPSADDRLTAPESSEAQDLRRQCPAESPGDIRLIIPMVANGRPAAATYMRAGDVHLPFQLHVLDMVGGRVSHVVAFLDGTMFARFGLPGSL